MELRAYRNKIPIILAVGLLCATAPYAIKRVITTGDHYLFTTRFFDDLVLRVTGPGRLRFIIQPLMATLLGIRHGRADAEAGRPNLLVRLFHWRHSGGVALRDLLLSLANLLAIAVLIDLIFQLILLRRAHPLAALLVGPLLVGIPYVISRGIAARSSRSSRRRC